MPNVFELTQNAGQPDSILYANKENAISHLDQNASTSQPGSQESNPDQVQQIYVSMSGSELQAFNRIGWTRRRDLSSKPDGTT